MNGNEFDRYNGFETSSTDHDRCGDVPIGQCTCDGEYVKIK